MRATKAQFEEFERSIIWLDLRDFLKDRLEGIRDELEDSPLDLISDVKNTMWNRGRAEEVRILLDLPKMLVENYGEKEVKEDG